MLSSQPVSSLVDRAAVRGARPDAARGPVNRAETARLLERYHRDRDPADREALVVRFLPLALHLARRYRGGIEREDLEQVASLGLIKALDRFDPTRGIAFTSFAVPTILGELKRHFRDLGWSVRVPRELQELALRVDSVSDQLTAELGRAPRLDEVADRCGATLEQVLEARATATAHHPDSLDRPVREEDEDVQVVPHEDPGYARAENAADFERLLSHLTVQERKVLRLRFEEDLVQREIAARMGLSQMQVSRMISRSINVLADRQRGRQVR